MKAEMKAQGHNSGLAKVAVPCFARQFYEHENFCTLHEVCAENAIFAKLQNLTPDKILTFSRFWPTVD